MTSSRLKSDPATIFDVFVELASPTSLCPCIVWKYPDDYFEEKILKHVVEFAFPCLIAEEAVQLFSFVLTNVEGKYTFGYCRHAPKSNTCLCFLSALPWPEFFYRSLNHIASLANNPGSNDVQRRAEIELLLVATYHQELPSAGELFVVETQLSKNKIECVRPDDAKLPKIPDNRHLTEYYNAVDEHNMVAVWASMLCERRIVMVSNKLGRLTSCILAANLLIYPMHWQHIFIPVLPEKLFNYLHAPMPFLIGVPFVNYAKAIKEVDTSDIVFLDIDNRIFKSPFNDVASLPAEVFIEDKLENLNCGFDGCLRDEFEQECSQYSGKEYGKFKNQYNEWFGNMKKEGGALMKQIKTKVSHFSSSVQVRTKGKEAMRDFKVMFNDLKDDSGMGSRTGSANKLPTVSSEKSLGLSQKLKHQNSTGSLNRSTENSKPLLNTLEDLECKSSESINKFSNRSDSSIDRRKSQPMKKGGQPPFRHASLLSKQGGSSPKRLLDASASSSLSSLPPRPASSTLLIAVDDDVDTKIHVSTGGVCASGVDVAHQQTSSSSSSLVDELRDVFSSPTELLMRLERAAASTRPTATVDDVRAWEAVVCSKVRESKSDQLLIDFTVSSANPSSTSAKSPLTDTFFDTLGFDESVLDGNSKFLAKIPLDQQFASKLDLDTQNHSKIAQSQTNASNGSLNIKWETFE